MTMYHVIFFYLIVDILADEKTFPEKIIGENNFDDYKNFTSFLTKAPKCCSNVAAYNPLKRICVFSSANINATWSTSGDLLNYNQRFGTPVCSKHDVVVDYEVMVTVKSESELMEPMRKSRRMKNESSTITDCDSDECNVLTNVPNYSLKNKYDDFLLEDLSNQSTAVTPEEKRMLYDARIKQGIPFNVSSSDGRFDDSFVFFQPDGTMKIGAEVLRYSEFCVDVRDELENTFYLTIRVCERADQWCNGERACIRKCCQDGESMLERKSLLDSGKEGKKLPPGRQCNSSTLGFPILKEFNLKSPVGVFNGEVCGRRRKYMLKPEDSPGDSWTLLEDGRLFAVNLPKDGPIYFPNTEYCIERVYSPNHNIDGIYAYLCFPKEPEGASDKADTVPTVKTVLMDVIYAGAILISCVFLVATLVAYAILPSLRNLHGVTLVSHASCLLAAFLCLATAKLKNNTFRGALGCKILGFSLLFTFLAAFSWLSIMCFDIWWTFGQGRVGSVPGSRGGSGNSGRILQGNLQRYIIYSIYAWMMPLTITTLTILADVYGSSLPYAPPGIGTMKCWFRDDGTWAVIIHFVGPCTVLLAADVIMFALTAVRCWRIKAEIQRMQQSDKEEAGREGECTKKFGRRWWKQTYKADKERLIMNLKLSAAMGINWSLEIASWWLSRGNDSSKDTILPKAIWYLSDVINCLHGVLVFIVFVGKKKIMAQLWKRLKDLCGCCPQVIVSEEVQNISHRDQHSYSSASLQNINAVSGRRTYHFNEGERQKIGQIRKWLINHGIYSRRKRNSKFNDRYLSKSSTTMTSVSTDMIRGNISYVP